MTPLARKAYKVEITVRSPMMCQGLDASALGVDASFIRNEQGWPILPADHVKGLLMAALRHRFADQAVVIGGARSRTPDDEPGLGEDSNAPNRGRLFLSDFVAMDATERGFTHRVAIDPDTGAAVDGALQEIELIAPLGASITFEGKITLYTEDAERDRERLSAALKSVPAVGAFKTAGFGEVVDAKVVGDAGTSAFELGPSTGGDRLSVEVIFDRPILVDAERVADNVFRSSAVIPGATLRGALAQTLARQGRLEELSATLETVRVGHAFPLDKDGQPMMRTPPLSLVSDLDAENIGCAIESPPGGGVLIGHVAAIFSNDWKKKHWKAAAAAMDWTAETIAASVQRTRVAIGEGGVAEDHRLFAHQAMPSLWACGPEQPRRWRLTLDRNAADPDAWAALLQTLAGGLDGVGKTDARLTVVSAVKASGADAPPMPTPLTVNGRQAWAVTLVTPALMLDPDAAWDAPSQYRAYWNWAFKELGGSGDIDLIGWFTNERLYGGYEAMRRGLFGPGRYQPLVITQPGSVFVLAEAAGVGDALWKALQRGLPPRPPQASGRSSLTWRDTTFVPENGYGQIAFHHEAHSELSKAVSHV